MDTKHGFWSNPHRGARALRTLLYHGIGFVVCVGILWLTSTDELTTVGQFGLLGGILAVASAVWVLLSKWRHMIAYVGLFPRTSKVVGFLLVVAGAGLGFGLVPQMMRAAVGAHSDPSIYYVVGVVGVAAAGVITSGFQLLLKKRGEVVH